MGFCAIRILRRLVRFNAESNYVLSDEDSRDVKDLQSRPGMRLINLWSPLCFAALPRVVDILSNQNDQELRVVLFFIQRGYLVTESDISSIDFATQSFRRRHVKSIVISDQFEKVCEGLHRSFSTEIAFVPTFKEGRAIAMQFSERSVS